MLVKRQRGNMPMSRTFSFSFACAALATSLAALSAQAMPLSSLDSRAAGPEVTLVAGGCGPGFHRGPLGACVANGVVIVPPVVVAPAVVVAPPVVIAPAPVVCGVGFRWHPRFRRCVVL
jgi:hypothetical protein